MTNYVHLSRHFCLEQAAYLLLGVSKLVEDVPAERTQLLVQTAQAWATVGAALDRTETLLVEIPGKEGQDI